MAVFAYKALDARQQSHSGTLTADTPALARQSLRAQGLSIAALDPVRPETRSWTDWKSLRRRGNHDDVAELWRNLAVLLHTGVPLTDALGVCREQQRGLIHAIIRQLQESVRGGLSLAEAVGQHGRWFDELTRAVVRVGEQSGSLAAALSELAEYQARQRATMHRLSTALIYPAILCMVGTGVVIFLMSYVVPQLLEVLASAGRELPAPTRFLKNLSDALVGHWMLLSVMLTGIAVALVGVRRTPAGQRLIERVTLAIPILGDLVRKAWVARISMMLATLLKADVRFNEALRTVRRGLPHRLYADQLLALEQSIEAGSAIAEPLKAGRMMPPLVLHLLAVGQESGELPAMLAQVRDAYEKEVQLALSRFLATLEPALILILAVVIGFVVFATLLPILETTRMVQ